jgi:molecular chaperone IbpA
MRFDFSPLYRSAIGFDRLAQMMDEAARADTQPAYPPYNIESVSDDQYRITMAVAGFQESELEIEVEQGSLKVVGRKQRDEGPRSFLHRGIAARDFEQRFQLAEHVKVTGAVLKDGLLNVELTREVPEAMKPRRVSINGNANNVRTIEQRMEAKAA